MNLVRFLNVQCYVRCYQYRHYVIVVVGRPTHSYKNHRKSSKSTDVIYSYEPKIGIVLSKLVLLRIIYRSTFTVDHNRKKTSLMRCH